MKKFLLIIFFASSLTAGARSWDALNMFPNSGGGEIILEYELPGEAEVKIEVYDVLGQLVYNETTQRTGGHQVHPVNLSGQATGVYFVRCTIKAGISVSSKTTKVTITH